MNWFFNANGWITNSANSGFVFNFSMGCINSSKTPFFYLKSRPEKFPTSMEKTTFTLKIAGFDINSKHKLTIHCVPSILAFHHAE